jgi:hypothetical protein
MSSSPLKNIYNYTMLKSNKCNFVFFLGKKIQLSEKKYNLRSVTTSGHVDKLTVRVSKGLNTEELAAEICLPRGP